MEVVSLERVVVALILVAGLQFAAAAPAAVTAGSSVVTPATAAGTVHELATAQGTVVIREAPAGRRSVACRDVVEARGGLDNDLIGLTHAATDAAGVCRYALSVPAQSAVWLHLRPELVDAARSTAAGANAFGANAPGTNAFSPPIIASRPERASSGSVQLRFRIIAPTTYFFAPGEQKDVSLTY